MDNFQLYYLCHPDTDEVRYVGITKNGLNYVQIGNKHGCSNKIIHKFIKKHKLYVK